MNEKEGEVGSREKYWEEREAANEKVGAAMASREKYWEERDTYEKLEALRRSLVRAYQVIERQSEQLGKLQTHEHGASGQVTFPLKGGGNELQFPRDRVPHELRRDGGG